MSFKPGHFNKQIQRMVKVGALEMNWKRFILKYHLTKCQFHGIMPSGSYTSVVTFQKIGQNPLGGGDNLTGSQIP